MGVRAAGGGGEQSNRGRQFRRVAQFSGSESHWEDWSFQFRAAARACSRGVSEVMKWPARADDSTTAEEIGDQLVDETRLDTWADELYDILRGVLSGEALAIIKGVSNTNGFVAWKRLYIRFNPIAPAKALSAMLEVMHPKKTDVNQTRRRWMRGRGSCWPLRKSLEGNSRSG